MFKLKRCIAVIVLYAIMMSVVGQDAQANTNFTTICKSTTVDNKNNNNIVRVVNNGVYIRGKYYNQTQFERMLNKAYSSYTTEDNIATLSSVAIVSAYFIPGIGEVAITVTGAVILAGVTIKAGTWIYKKIKKWVKQKKIEKQEINNAKSKIPSRLKDKNGNVNLGLFNQNVRGGKSKKEKGGWSIDKDTAGHKGSKWKLKDKKNNRVASLDGKGRVVGK